MQPLLHTREFTCRAPARAAPYIYICVRARNAYIAIYRTLYYNTVYVHSSIEIVFCSVYIYTCIMRHNNISAVQIRSLYLVDAPGKMKRGREGGGKNEGRGR